jgi:hypothetical protein
MYTASRGFMSLSQDLISDIIPNQESHVSIGLIIKYYGAMDIWNLGWHEP